MALIAFCAIALVENVTNAHPVGREGRRGRDGGTVEGRRGREEGQEEEEEEGEDKKEQKQDKRVGHVVIKKPKQRLIQRTVHRRTTSFSVAVETTAEKRSQCHDNHNPFPDPVPPPRPIHRKQPQSPSGLWIGCPRLPYLPPPRLFLSLPLIFPFAPAH